MFALRSRLVLLDEDYAWHHKEDFGKESDAKKDEKSGAKKDVKNLC